MINRLYVRRGVINTKARWKYHRAARIAATLPQPPPRRHSHRRAATELQVLTQVYLPMCKSTIATVALFFAISRWNGYFWARQMISNQNEHPLQVFIRLRLEQYTDPEQMAGWNRAFASDSVIYALIVWATS